MAHMAHVLITGHSRGLGAAIATALLAQGHTVLGLSRTPMGSRPADQTRFSEMALDLANVDALKKFLNTDVMKNFFAASTQAVLINNAGLLHPIGPAGSLASQAIIESVTVNVAAALALSNAFIAATSGLPDRRLVQISSGAARSAYAGWNIYCATKASLDHYVRCLALESHPGLAAESLAPGVIDTDMQSQVRSATLEQFPMRRKFDDLKASGALASPESAAKQLIAHLLSPRFGQEPCTDLRQR